MSRDRKRLETERARWERGWSAVARTLKEKDPDFLPFLGSLAWGRYEGESHPDESKDNIANGLGFLEGARYALLQVARTLRRTAADEALSKIHREMDS